MKSTPFNPDTDLAPIPFTDQVCSLAKRMKEQNLAWQPHVGCFVWDELELIEPSSPFPHRIYFILNLGHFLRRFETVQAIAENLIWLPTWHQALQICKRLGVPDEKIIKGLDDNDQLESESLVFLYRLMLEHL